MKLQAIFRIDRGVNKKIVSHMPGETFECADEEADTFIRMGAARRVVEGAAPAKKVSKASKPKAEPTPEPQPVIDPSAVKGGADDDGAADEEGI